LFEDAGRSFLNNLLLNDLLVAKSVGQAGWLQCGERLSLPLGPVASKGLGPWREAYRLGPLPLGDVHVWVIFHTSRLPRIHQENALSLIN
jgi:hypothetical protein